MRTVLGVLCVWLWAAGLAGQDQEPRISAVRRQAMIARVDELIAARCAQDQIALAESSSDAEFLRRVSLDLVGVLPRVAETRQFLAETDPRKRAALIERLLATPRHATHMANVWRQIMLPGGVDLDQVENAAGVQQWLRTKFAENLRYDRLVSEFLVATGGGDSGPALYYTVLDLKPEKLAASTSRIFLGLRLECAECHQHPFEDWTQRSFWGYAAFFAQLQQRDVQTPRGRQTRLIDVDRGEVRLPNSDEVVAPRYLDGSPISAEERGSRRMQLAIWMASRDNPYLPRAVVNRVWWQLFGRGMVDPVDDLHRRNPPSHPELLDELSAYFVEAGFDLRELLRTLTNTATYQRTSRGDGPPPPADYFASMAIKTLSPDQLYDALSQFSGSAIGTGPTGVAAQPPLAQQRLAFVAKMQMQGANAAEFVAGVPQALTLLNGGETAAAADLERGSLLVSLEAPWLDDAERIESLYLATLCRPPTDRERQHCAAAIAAYSSSNPDGRRAALADALWAILNTAEFGLNH